MHILVLHDGELDDVCGIVSALGHPFTERQGELVLHDAERSWDLVIGSPHRVLRCEPLLGRPETRVLVVAAQLSRTLSRRLGHMGIDLVVRRPVHPQTLRLLLVHELYRGPERRRAARVAVGVPVLVRTGWLPRRALLQDLSVRGAQLHARFGLRTGTALNLRVPALEGALALRGQVVRARVHDEGGHELGVLLDHGERAKLPRLRELVAHHARGPAVWSRPLPARGPARGERRETERLPYDRRVIALGAAGPRVLLGRDLSLGGLRVEGQAGLWTGERLQVALHARAGEVPLVVDAEVVRDAAEGVGLRFRDLTDDARKLLHEMLEVLPGLAAPASPRSERRVLAEVLGDANPAALRAPAPGSPSRIG